MRFLQRSKSVDEIDDSPVKEEEGSGPDDDDEDDEQIIKDPNPGILIL